VNQTGNPITKKGNKLKFGIYYAGAFGPFSILSHRVAGLIHFAAGYLPKCASDV